MKFTVLSVINLQRFIGGRTQNEIDSLVSSKTGGCTPLLIACRNGHYDVVQYLIKRCHADVEQCGSVIFDGETIENGKCWQRGRLKCTVWSLHSRLDSLHREMHDEVSPQLFSRRSVPESQNSAVSQKSFFLSFQHRPSGAQQQLAIQISLSY